MALSTAEIWDQFNHRLLEFIRRRVGDPDDAEDLVQDVFIKIHTHIDTLQEEERIVPWMYQIARNTVTDYYRSRKSYISVPDDLHAEDDGIDEDDPIHSLGAGLQGMIDQLETKYRQPLILAELQGMKQSDIAAQLGLSVSGAKSRIQRGRVKLRDLLMDCCHFEFDQRGGVTDYFPKQVCCQNCQC